MESSVRGPPDGAEEEEEEDVEEEDDDEEEDADAVVGCCCCCSCCCCGGPAFFGDACGGGEIASALFGLFDTNCVEEMAEATAREGAEEEAAESPPSALFALLSLLSNT